MKGKNQSCIETTVTYSLIRRVSCNKVLQMPEILADTGIRAGGQEFIKYNTILRRIDLSGCDIRTLLAGLFDGKHRNCKSYYDKGRQRKFAQHR